LLPGDIPGGGYEMLVRYNAAQNNLELLNPALELGAGTWAINSQFNVSSYTYLPTDAHKLVERFNGSAMTDTLPQAGAAFPRGWKVDVMVVRTSAGLTITPNTSTIDGLTSLFIGPGRVVTIWSDGSNYQTRNPVSAYGDTMGGTLNFIQGSDVVAAATLNLDVVNGNLIRLTGTTPITAITLANGSTRELLATAATPITTSNSLVIAGLPSGTVYTTAPGEIFTVEAFSGVVFMIPSNVVPGVGTSPVLLSQTSYSNAGTAPIVLPAGYKHFVLEINEFIPVSNAILQMQVSSNGGSTWDTTSNYSWIVLQSNLSATNAQGSTSDTAFGLSPTGGSSGDVSSSAEGWSGTVKLFNPLFAQTKNKFTVLACYDSALPDFRTMTGSGEYLAMSAYNAVRLQFSTGNIFTGTIELWGIP
jgi:hypothetical protein